VNVPDLVARFGADPGQFLLDYGLVGLYGIAVWGLAAPLLAALAYALLKPTLLAMGARVRSSAAAPPPPGG
jgi:hypothetical protein